MAAPTFEMSPEDAELYRLYSEEAAYYDRLQYVFKIKLNSLYGALTNLYFRFYDLRMGESTTATGRVILKHQCRKVAETLEGNYNVDFPLYEGMKAALDMGYTGDEARLITLDSPMFGGKHQSDSVIYGDSVAGDTVIETPQGPLRIEELFTAVDFTVGEKEYSNCVTHALTYDLSTHSTRFGVVKYVMRHLTSKVMYRVWVTNSQYIDVTEDHALIGYANTKARTKQNPGMFQEVTPQQLQSGGSLIYQKSIPTIDTIVPATYPVELYQLAGYVMGNGHVDTTATGGILLSIDANDLDEVVERVLTPLQQCDQPWALSWTLNPNGHDVHISSERLRVLFRDWLYTAGEKRTPMWAYTLPSDARNAYLRGWFSANGWINNNSTPGLTNAHQHNIQDCRRLLMLSGISSTWCTDSTENSFNGVVSGTYSKRLTIKSRYEFNERVGFIQQRKQLVLLPSRNKRRQATQGYDFELVTPVKIEKLPATSHYVYDIEVDDTHMFFANNILVHNTDSTYFKTYADNVADAILIADAVAEKVNDSYPGFMRQTFLCTSGYDSIIKAGREIVSDRGIFVEKKRYILHLVDLDGKTVDKMKVMGLDTKKTTLPAEVSANLNGFIERFLKGEAWETVSESIVEYKERLINAEPMQIGLPKGIKGIEDYAAKYEDDTGTRLPGHVAAAIHYNICLREYKDKASLGIKSGMKIKVFYLHGNHGKFKSIALPTDLEVVPKWFLDHFRIDRDAHIERLVDNPLSNILKAIGKEPPSRQSLLIDSLLVY